MIWRFGVENDTQPYITGRRIIINLIGKAWGTRPGDCGFESHMIIVEDERSSSATNLIWQIAESVVIKQRIK